MLFACPKNISRGRQRLVLRADCSHGGISGFIGGREHLEFREFLRSPHTTPVAVWDSSGNELPDAYYTTRRESRKGSGWIEIE